MLKKRLFLALATVILLILAAGGFGVWLLRDHVASFQRVVERNFEGIKVINDFRVMSAQLESSYLPALVGDAPPDLRDDGVFREMRTEFVADLVRLDELAHTRSFGEKEEMAIVRLGEAVEEYLARFEALFEAGLPAASQPDRIALRRGILEASYKMADQVDVLLELLEGAVSDEHERAIRQARNSATLLAILTAAAVAIAGSVYLVLSRQVMKPLAELGESMGEVQQQNFERVLPVKSRDEIGQVAAAFNNMAAELRVMKMETDQEMLRLNQESRAILMGFPHPIFILDGRGGLSQRNPAAETLMKQIGRAGDELPPKVERKVGECIESGESYLPDEIDAALLFRPGEREIWYLPRIFRIREHLEDEFQGWAVALMDVTRVRWLDDMKTDLIGTVSHEIKTPLTSIRMVLHLLSEQKTGELNETQDSIVTSARDDCERLLETLDNLLQLSRFESGEPALQREPVEPGLLIEDAADSFAGHVEEANLTVRTESSDRLPRVLADRHRIGQVFKNLLSNAVKHSPEGSEILLAAAKSGERFIRFSVTDSGAGISEEDQDRIFERFYRSPGQEGDGTGLGLSICREIVRAHAGQIGVNSTPGGPTEFFFHLPLSSQ